MGPNPLQSVYIGYSTFAKVVNKNVGRKHPEPLVLGLSAPNIPVDPALLKRPGAFAWWYVDLVDEHGDGLVLIWSWGLPFLPGLAGAARRGAPVAPGDRPSMNVAVYQGGMPRFYLLQEIDPQDARWDPETDRWEFGQSRITLDRTSDGRHHLRVTLDCPVPGMPDRLQGTVEVIGHERIHEGDGHGDPRHAWTPLMTACPGTAKLRCGDWSADITGRAYHDRNSGVQPMHTLGIDRWWWGRLALPGRELIYYHLVPEDPGEDTQTLVVEVDSNGRTRLAESARVEILDTRRSIYSLSWTTRLRFWDPDGQEVRVRMTAGVDDSPFYQRLLIEGTCGGESGRGVAELVVPDAIDPDWMRWLVGMRVHHAGGDNSVWLPLFSGPREGRPGRVLGQLLGRPAAPAQP